MEDAEMKAKFLDAIKDPETAAVLEAVLAPIVAAAVKAAMESKEEEIAVLREELKETKAKLDDLEQYSRKNCVNISGVPETAGESTSQLVRDLSKIINVDISPTDIDACHRIGRLTAGKPRTIIVKFARFDQRQELYAARRQLREVAAPAGGRFTAQQLEKIFISDNLTQHRQSVLYAARQLRRKGKLFAAWSDVGRLKVRVTKGGDTKHITSFDDLRGLVGSDPDLPRAEPVARPAAAAADAVAERVASVQAAPNERPPVAKGKGKRGAR
ncbi:hypothetical protein FJT64_018513 [Amphibalanus amphitrite]|uniref:Uncharacterized protein n=1 Tax=Amphibalanus amphitrite TaxID=1232801 RepID=A0A6A4WSM1_AMPAM|nr:hypothetical protein FJT64_021350 [Amphibalanus amphitrite]KAF0310506.1 hypothetical protein FJT64_018513 [Amphibalanus amphitrite]